MKSPMKAPPKVAAKVPAKVPAKAPPKVAAVTPVSAKTGARPVAPVKGGARPAPKAKVKLKSAQRPPAVVHPLGVLPPEAISRIPQKPARPAPAPPRAQKPARPSANDTGAKPLTAKDFPEFEQRLHGDRVRVLKEMGHYENTVLKVNQRDSSGDLSGYSFHMADVGTDAMEREKAFQLASAEGRILLEINEALRRLARGEYGVCESCESPILRARLEAMPTARLCLSCKEKEERAARGLA
jgi:RNA polymerase-binding transcription factor DksA